MTFPVAHLNIHDVELVLVFVDQATKEKQALYKALSLSTGHNLVLVWQDEFGRTRFIAPPEQHSFFQVLGYDQLYAQVNSTLDFSGIAAPPLPAHG